MFARLTFSRISREFFLSERAKKVAKRGKAGCSSSRIGEIARHHSLFPSRNERKRSASVKGASEADSHMSLSRSHKQTYRRWPQCTRLSTRRWPKRGRNHTTCLYSLAFFQARDLRDVKTSKDTRPGWINSIFSDRSDLDLEVLGCLPT